MLPLHTWLPDAHTAAPTTGSVLLAGVLLKMGTYGFVRIARRSCRRPRDRTRRARRRSASWASSTDRCACRSRASRDGDLKRLIAYSSIGHMGFVLLGIGSLTPVGMNAALFASVAHGLITGLLFFLVGGLKDAGALGEARRHRPGSVRAGPKYGVLIAFAAMASLGLPGLAGFWGEVLALFCGDQAGDRTDDSVLTSLWRVAGARPGADRAYLLPVVRRVCMGPAATPSEEPVTELTAVETATLDAAGLLTLLAGLWPAVLLGITNPAVHVLMKGVCHVTI